MPIIVALLASAQPPVVVSPLTTQQLVSHCQGDGAGAQVDFCTGYVLGIMDALSLSHAICPSAEGTSSAQVVGLVRRYLKAHRKAWSSAPSFLVRTALQRAYPCRIG